MVPGGIGVGSSPGGFCDVERDRQRSSTELVGEGGLALGEPGRQVHREGEEPDGAPIDIEPLEAEHGAVIGARGRRLRTSAVAVAAAVNAQWMALIRSHRNRQPSATTAA